MFTNVCFTLALAASSAFALTVNTPSGVTSGGTTTITWTSTSSDSVFSIELLHSSFNSDFAIANNVQPANNNLTVTIPPVPADDDYTLQFVNITDINQVFATSGSFSIGAAVSASGSSTGSGTGGSSTSGAAGPSSTSGASGSTTASGSASGSKASSTSPSSSGSASASGSSISPSTTPSGAAPFRAPISVAVSALVAVAAAAFVL
ncbi:hypothetical protein B0H16DRAFT_1517464 [Mycena metata]|uniref:Yeast cell wall synthesis Kre9/Knh1-like N-terminal domain-containing protein n=1 Tax=Mycena metata TaxID=1033252 RepID=A0AAD7JPL8_9AGAR|nr:hypothetical protein B0H16DRAFT_1517464 [Mycena metata]